MPVDDDMEELRRLRQERKARLLRESMRTPWWFWPAIVVCIATTLGAILSGWLLTEPPPPYPSAKAFTPPEPPLYLQHTYVISKDPRLAEWVLSKEAKLLMFERCEGAGGRVVHGWQYVECWSGEPFESPILWSAMAEEKGIEHYVFATHELKELVAFCNNAGGGLDWNAELVANPCRVICRPTGHAPWTGSAWHAQVPNKECSDVR